MQFVPIVHTNRTVVRAYRRIAVALDGTSESEQALRWASTIAKRTGCSLDLVHVSAPVPVAPELYVAPVMNEGAVEALREIATKRLRELERDLARVGAQAQVTVLDGVPSATLGDHFRETTPDLIVMTTHDRGRLEHVLFGSVSASVTRHTHVPVLLVRPVESGAPLDLDVEVQHMLIPLDGSAFGAEIVPHATTLARVLHADVTLLTVLQPMLAVASSALGTGPDAVVPPELSAVAATLQSDGVVSVRTAVLTDGQPAHAIAGYADANKMDLIAMTTHGRGALKRLVAGSVSNAVVRSSRLPMLMFRPNTS